MSDRHASGEFRQRLTGRGYDHDPPEINDLAQQTNDSLKHLFGTKGERRLVPSHATRLATAENDRTLFHVVTLSVAQGICTKSVRRLVSHIRGQHGCHAFVSFVSRDCVIFFQPPQTIENPAPWR